MEVERAEVTVAIPLHDSSRWRENVLENVRRISGITRILISDPFEADDTLAWLADQLPGAQGLECVGRRTLEPGWPRHVNDLVGRMETPLGMVLAHDDEISTDWITEASHALAEEPDAVLAVGPLEGIAGPGNLLVGHIITLDERLRLRSFDQRMEAAGRFLVGDQANLGLVFRGVFRTQGVIPVPEGLPGDRWADLYWACGMLAGGPFAGLPGATYRKRFRHEATHLNWGPFDFASVAEAIREQLLPLIAPDLRDRAAQQLFDGAIRELSESNSRLARAKAAIDIDLHASRGDAEQLRLSLQASSDLVEHLNERLELVNKRLEIVYRSRSWRLTEPLRRVPRMFRGNSGR